MGVLGDPIDEAREDSVTYAWLFLGIGVIVGLANFFQVVLYCVICHLYKQIFINRFSCSLLVENV